MSAGICYPCLRMLTRDTDKKMGRPRVKIPREQLVQALQMVLDRTVRPGRVARILGVAEKTLIIRWSEIGWRVFYSKAVGWWVAERISGADGAGQELA